MSHGYFVTGTDTDVGKTVVAAILALTLDAIYWKPIQCGSPFDSETVGQWIGHERIWPEAERLVLAASPHAAARAEGRALSLARVISASPPPTCPHIIEGAGGALVPINEKYLMIDLIATLGLPTVIVSRSGLGTINHTLLTVEALRARKVEVAGVVMVGPENASNRQAIENYGKVTVLGQIPIAPRLSTEWLEEAGRGLSLRATKGHVHAYS